MSASTFEGGPADEELPTVSAEEMAETGTPIARRKVKAKRGPARGDTAPMMEEPTTVTRESRPRAATKRREVAKPALKVTNPTKGSEGVCGYFIWTRQLAVSNAVKPGVIVQKVTRNFSDVARWDAGLKTWIALSGAEIDTYVGTGESSCYATVSTYWEIWRVRPDGSVIGQSDMFSLCAIVPDGTDLAHARSTSKGKYTIAGEMYYYEAPDGPPINPDALGFAVDVNHPAGQLPHRDDDPETDLTARGFVKHEPAVTVQVTSKWNSRKLGEMESRVTAT